jgi:hypothetical protein
MTIVFAAKVLAPKEIAGYGRWPAYPATVEDKQRKAVWKIE